MLPDEKRKGGNPVQEETRFKYSVIGRKSTTSSMPLPVMSASRSWQTLFCVLTPHLEQYSSGMQHTRWPTLLSTQCPNEPFWATSRCATVGFIPFGFSSASGATATVSAFTFHTVYRGGLSHRRLAISSSDPELSDSVNLA